MIRLPVEQGLLVRFQRRLDHALGRRRRLGVPPVRRSRSISTAAADDMYVVLDLHWSDMGVRGAYNGQHYMPDAE